MRTTLAEQNYLKTIFHLEQAGGGKVSNLALAEQLSTRPASVTGMLKKLSAKGFLVHAPYRGVALTETGKTAALQIIRKHRLWEVFLVSKLGFTWDQVHDVAEQLEHVYSPLLTERLDKFLGRPTLDPHGDPIPDAQGKFRHAKQLRLDKAPVGATGQLVRASDDDPELLQYLQQLNVGLGATVAVVDRQAYDHSLRLRLEQRTLNISEKVAKNLWMQEN